jgi:hypothetical protein
LLKNRAIAASQSLVSSGAQTATQELFSDFVQPDFQSAHHNKACNLALLIRGNDGRSERWNYWIEMNESCRNGLISSVAGKSRTLINVMLRQRSIPSISARVSASISATSLVTSAKMSSSGSISPPHFSPCYVR